MASVGTAADRISGPSWTVESGCLRYYPATGGPITPPAKEIWAAIFGGKQPFAINPAIALPSIRFSRFPAEVGLLVSGALPFEVNVSLVILAGGREAILEDSSADQAIVDSVWYPLETDTYSDDLRELASRKIENGKPINAGQLIWLRSRIGAELKLYDDVINASPPGKSQSESFDARSWGLLASLYEYQKDGVQFMAGMARSGLGCLLGDEMGLGKTVQVIALILSELHSGRGPTLVVSPATLLENWRRELAQFAPSLSVLLHAGSKRVGIAAGLKGYDVVVTSYDTAVRDAPTLSSISWNLLALDEAQSIKNPRAKRTLATKSLPRRISVAITGTPVENSLLDLWSLSDFVLPGLLGDHSSFDQTFADSEADAKSLADLVAPILLRRRVREVAKDLPPRMDVPQPIAMSRWMAERYEEVRRLANEEYGKSGALVALLKLRMFCTHPRLQDYSLNDPSEQMPKYQRLVELLEEIFALDEKCLIFTSFTGMTDIFMGDLVRRFPRSYFGLIDGRIHIDKRQPAVDDFTASTRPGAVFLNPKAAGVGLNITTANHVIHYNPEWNPAVEDQASARAFRRRQTRPVTVHSLYFVDSVEEVMIERLKMKRSLSESAAVGHQGEATASDVMAALAASPLSHQDILE